MSDLQKYNMARMDAALSGETAIIRVFGRATFTIATDLKQFASSAMQHGYNRLALDMEHCETMDSTFIGVMAGLAIRLKQHGGVGVFVINLDEKNLDILQTLGVDCILQCSLVGAAPEELRELVRRTTAYYPLMHTSRDRQTAMRDMLEAHNSLINADPANLVKFKDVIDYLRQDAQGKD
ncbi:MAG: STAS domain-containing protein [Kiritimatiellia bacterium]|jgi:anti-sigma B factor antagonist